MLSFALVVGPAEVFWYSFSWGGRLPPLAPPLPPLPPLDPPLAPLPLLPPLEAIVSNLLLLSLELLRVTIFVGPAEVFWYSFSNVLLLSLDLLRVGTYIMSVNKPRNCWNVIV